MQTCTPCGTPEQSGRFCTNCGAALGWQMPDAPGASAPRSPARTFVIVGLVVALCALLGIVAVAVTRSSDEHEVLVGRGVGPWPGRDHWHAALGVYVCDHWLTGTEPDLLTGEDSPSGAWAWPDLTPAGEPARVGSDVYAGLHSHNDGIIHMEPLRRDESGNGATLGRYFEFGGWSLGTDHIDFLDEHVRTGGDCSGQPAVVRWSVNGRERAGDPAVVQAPRRRRDRGRVRAERAEPPPTAGAPPSVRRLGRVARPPPTTTDSI